MDLLREALIFLAATVIAVPIFERLGLGSVLGYLTAGVVIGPWGLGAIGEVEGVMHFAELGVVLLLFLIGLELQPTRLWELRRNVFGLGALQVGATATALGAIALATGLGWRAALVAGVGLSLSSTALALQVIGERKELATDYGQRAFGILLFQDLAVLPLLALLPVMGSVAADHGHSPWTGLLRIAGVLIGVILTGRFVVRKVFRVVARTKSQELFTATALLVALGTAALVNKVGLSMALGAFLAGVMLADSEYRHELEADIQPFKGLLLGLFFISVGMSVNLGLVASSPLTVLGLLLGLLVVKSAVLFAMGRATCRDNDQAASLAIVLSQGGEFAFVLFSVAVGHQVLDRHLADLLVVVVAISMATTPALFMLHERVLRPRLVTATRREFDVAPDRDSPVIIAGFGRVGQVVGRVLAAKHIRFTALDSSSEHIDFVKRFGNKVFYGDAARLDLLRAARADKAKVFVIAIEDVDASLRTAKTLLDHFPHLTILARARNRQHAYALLNLGITHVVRETFVSSLELTTDVLESLGLPREEATHVVQRFREHDEQLLLATYQVFEDEEKLVEIAQAARAELESLFEKDTEERASAA